MIKVLIVDDQELFRESLKVVLGVSENIQVTDAVSGVAQALKSAEQKRPDVVLMDIRMPGMDGVEGTRLFKKRWPNIKIIVLTTFDDDAYIFGALKNGASGYLLKGSSISKLSESIRIAQELSLSEGTVRNSISSILFKLGLRDRTQLAIWAVQTGVVNGPL